MERYFFVFYTGHGPAFGRWITSCPEFTDASRYRDQLLYNNWNLSGERALMAHKALVNGGLDEGRVLQINAMADQMLLDPTDPLAAKNRRIEIMVLTKTASDTLYQFFGHHGENVVKPAAEKAEK